MADRSALLGFNARTAGHRVRLGGGSEDPPVILAVGQHGEALPAGEEAREGEVEGALKSTSVVSACRIRYRRKQNEAVCSSLALLFIVRLFLELELPMSIG